MNMITPSGDYPSDTFHDSIAPRGTMLPGKNGNTHVVPPACRVATTIELHKV
jgi:hypothetical protein